MKNKNCHCLLDNFDAFACYHCQTHSIACNMNHYHSHYSKEIRVLFFVRPLLCKHTDQSHQARVRIGQRTGI